MRRISFPLLAPQIKRLARSNPQSGLTLANLSVSSIRPSISLVRPKWITYSSIVAVMIVVDLSSCEQAKFKFNISIKLRPMKLMLLQQANQLSNYLVAYRTNRKPNQISHKQQTAFPSFYQPTMTLETTRRGRRFHSAGRVARTPTRSLDRDAITVLGDLD